MTSKAIARPVDDDYPTEPGATRALFSAEIFEGVIWDPFAGAGAMAQVLRETHDQVYASTINGYPWNGWKDVEGQKDFFEADIPADEFDIVANPPYGKLHGKTDRKAVEKILRRAISLQPRKIALLLGLQFLCGETRRDTLFAEHPPARVHPFVNRLTFYPQGVQVQESTFKHNHGWFVWDWPYKPGRIELGTLLNSKDFAA